MLTAELDEATATALRDAGLRTLGGVAAAPANQIAALAQRAAFDEDALRSLLDRENERANERARPSTIEGWIDALLGKARMKHARCLFGLEGAFEGKLGVRVKELADHDGLTTAAIYIALGESRETWAKHAAVDELRDVARRRAHRAAGGAGGRREPRSSRLEIYERGMPKEHALALSASLLKSGITPGDVVRRVALRYPDAEPLPSRPALDALLAPHGLTWSEASGTYHRPDALERPSFHTRSSTPGRFATALPSQALSMEPDAVVARQFDERLRNAIERGARGPTPPRGRAPAERREEIGRARFRSRPERPTSRAAHDPRSRRDGAPSWRTAERRGSASPPPARGAEFAQEIAPISLLAPKSPPKVRPTQVRRRFRRPAGRKLTFCHEFATESQIHGGEAPKSPPSLTGSDFLSGNRDRKSATGEPLLRTRDRLSGGLTFRQEFAAESETGRASAARSPPKSLRSRVSLEKMRLEGQTGEAAGGGRGKDRRAPNFLRRGTQRPPGRCR